LPSQIVAVVTGCGGRRYHGTADARLVRFQLQRRLLGERARRDRGRGQNRHLFDGTPVWIDGANDDPFRSADAELAHALRGRVSYHVWPGGHNSKYWDAHMAAYLRFYSGALARCPTGSQ
jgi:hypothetical protein